MSDLRSVTACAKALGMQRQRLSLILDQEKVSKVKQGREALVEFDQVCAIVQKAASEGKIRSAKKSMSGNPHSDLLVAQLQRENDELRAKHKALETQNALLIDKVDALHTFEAKVKLLESANAVLLRKTHGGVKERIKKAFNALTE